MATVSTEVVDIDGLGATYNAASGGGDKFTPGDRVFLHVVNGSAASITATAATPGTIVGQSIPDAQCTVPAGAERLWGPFPARLFAGQVDGLVAVTWSATTTVTFAAVRV